MPNRNHYVKRADITAAIVNGGSAKALCGQSLEPHHQGANAIPGQEVAHRKLHTCELCETLFNALPADEEVNEPMPASTLRDLRERVGMSLSDLAGASGFTPAFVTAVESGNLKATDAVIARLSEVIARSMLSQVVPA